MHFTEKEKGKHQKICEKHVEKFAFSVRKKIDKYLAGFRPTKFSLDTFWVTQYCTQQKVPSGWRGRQSWASPATGQEG